MTGKDEMGGDERVKPLEEQMWDSGMTNGNTDSREGEVDGVGSDRGPVSIYVH